MAKPWIKLWVEMLSDPKVARLSDDQYRKFIEVLLLAGYQNESGKLPALTDIAWMLHLSEADAETALMNLSRCGLVHKDDTGWIVTNFDKRQETPAAARMRKMRERQKEHDSEQLQRNSYGNSYGIDSASASASDSLIKLSIKSKEIYALYEAEIGTITKSISGKLDAAWQDYPHEWIPMAFSEAADHNARNWKYVEAILKRWKSDGFQSKNGKGSGSKKESIFDIERRRIAAEEAAEHGK